MSNSYKFWLMILTLMIWAMSWFAVSEFFDIRIMFGAVNVINFIAVSPIVCIFLAEITTGQPEFIRKYMNEVVERDSERVVLSINALGALTLVLAPVVIYFIFA